MDDYEPVHMKLWTMPADYAGEVWPGYYVFLGQHRDSHALDRSNFACGLAEIGGESDTVIVVREYHWVAGWVEWIAIHQDDSAALEEADSVLAALADYAVLDDVHFRELEREDACETWRWQDTRERAAVLARAGTSIFAARRDEPPFDLDDSGALLEILRGD